MVIALRKDSRSTHFLIILVVFRDSSITVLIKLKKNIKKNFIENRKCVFVVYTKHRDEKCNRKL